jgi:hypothetical protein
MNYYDTLIEVADELSGCPLLPAFVLYGFGVIPGRGVLGMQMTPMVPAMLAAMLYRKEESARSISAPRAASAARWVRPRPLLATTSFHAGARRDPAVQVGGCREASSRFNRLGVAGLPSRR